MLSYEVKSESCHIKNKRLYLLKKNGEIISAFALSDTNPGENAVVWKDKYAISMRKREQEV